MEGLTRINVDMSGITVRKPTEADVDMMGKFMEECYKTTHTGQGKDVYLNEHGRGHHFFVLEKDGEVKGIGSWTLRGLVHHEVIRINRLGICSRDDIALAKPLFRAMAEDADKFFKEQGFKLRKCFQLVHSTDAPMVEILESLGLEKEAVIKEHFWKGVDELVYSMWLN